MEEALRENEVHRTQGWNLFILLPRMLLHRPARGGNIPKSSLEKFDDLCAGLWARLLAASASGDEDAGVARHRKRRQQRPKDEVKRRASGALNLVQMGELSADLQALEAATVAPGENSSLCRIP